MSFHLNLILLLAFLCGALATQETEQKDIPFLASSCPLVDDLNHIVLLPYGPDCSKYYRCLNGQAYLQQCPYNMHWNAATYRCDQPEIARCQTASATLTITPSLPTSYPYNPINPIPATPTFPSVYPYIPNNPEVIYQSHPNDCSIYYQCQAKQCPSNLYWNSYTKQCDYPQNVQCPVRSLYNLADGTPTEAV